MADAAEYDAAYSTPSYDTHVWDMQKPWLRGVFASLRAATPTLKYLDFACGSGRIIVAVEDLVSEAIGVDISSTMLATARVRLQQVSFREGDILTTPDLIDNDYDVITAFRFFLNTEPEMRRAIMTDLAGRLRDTRSRLIFNIHGNRYSYLGLRSLLTFDGGSRYRMMSYAETRRLAETSGLEIEACAGFGLVPRWFFGRRRLLGSMTVLDRWAAEHRWFRGISRDLVFVCRCRPKSAATAVPIT
jgi:SAM-dependent methyltransferase